MKIDVNKLKSLCKKHTVKVSFNGFSPFTQEVIDVYKLFDEIHLVADVDIDEFRNNVNQGKYYSSELESIFKNVKCQGVMKMKGFEALSNEAYVECKELKWLQNESK